MKRLILGLIAAVTGVAQTQNAVYVDLSGPWRAQRGDDPGYAQPEFDDGGWREVKLPISDFGPNGVTQEIIGVRDANAFRLRGRTTFFWLRRRVDFPVGADRSRLALTLGVLRDGYTVYVNGQRIGELGNIDALEKSPMPQPRTFAIPPGAVPPGEPLTIALRVYRRTIALPVWRLADRGPYLLTYLDHAPSGEATAQWNQRAVENAPRVMFATIMLVIAVLSLFAWWGDRSRRELLWFALMSLAGGGVDFFLMSQLSPAALPLDRWGGSLLQIGLSFIQLPLTVELALAALGTPRRLWWRMAAWAGFVMSLSVRLPPHQSLLLWWGVVVGACATIGVVLLDRLRPARPALAWDEKLLRATLVFQALGTIEDFGRRILRIPNVFPASFYVGGYSVDRQDLLWTGPAALILAMLLRRQAADRRERQRLASEFEAAGVIQRLLLRDATLRNPGLTLDAVYEPALEVGGDFYYVLGGEVVVAGDVSGKGLKAAMLVSLLVGVLRDTAERSPGLVLAALNRAVAGQIDGGFVTCCCVRFGADGVVTAANAGHIAPYIDGAEAACETGLPLGLAAEVSYEETRLQLAPGSALTLVSDGVVEAADIKGELFGFDRTGEISGKSAREIAEAARTWGQNDDITVVTVRRSS